MKKSILLCFICLAYTGLVMAADFVPPRHNIQLGLGGLRVTALDRVNSSLPYTGFGPSILLGYSMDKGRFQLSGANTFSLGSLHAIKYPDNPQLVETYIYDRLIIEGYFRLMNKTEEKLSLYVGPQLGLTMGYRIKGNDVGNSLLAYNIASSTNLTVKLVKYFERKHRRKPDKPNRNLAIEGYFSYPLMANVWYQPYIGLSEDLLQEDTKMIDQNSQYTSYVTDYVDLEMGLNFKFYLRNNNALGISYNYSFIKTKPEYNPHKGQMHGLMFSLYFNLK
jgi:hypothetical protein